MRASRPHLAGLFALFALACAHPGQVPSHGQTASLAATPLPRVAAAAPAAPSAPLRIDFTTQIQPILTAHCQPCHFAGGTMYARLPFDRAETVLRLREKLFTRLKDEDERRTIRTFLAEHPAADGR